MNAADFKAWCEQYSYRQAEKKYLAPLVMGILNITPDSFSDGGEYLGLPKALQRAEKMIQEGADLIDIGGESSRPGAKSISVQEELDRILPIIQGLRQNSDICISVDTCKAPVMKAALEAGANLVNDISALQEEEALKIVAHYDAPVCLMHMQGNPQSMQDTPFYNDSLLETLQRFFKERIRACLAAGIRIERIIIDPGFGFGKTAAHNLMLIRQLEVFQQQRRPILLGFSRKSTLGTLLNQPVQGRLYGGLALTVLAARAGATLFRTHDVKETVQTLKMLAAVYEE